MVEVDVGKDVASKLYYYTDFETFKLILENGTLRFKESTSSNDLKDTKEIYDRLTPNIYRYISENSDVKDIEFIKGLAEHVGFRTNRVSLVACFSGVKDSRFMWDSYTMHRKDREQEKYNGVCIEIETAELIKAMNSDIAGIDWKTIHHIIYGDIRIDHVVETLLEQYHREAQELKQDSDQSQDLVPEIRVQLLTRVIGLNLKKYIVYPTLRLLDMLERLAPIFKHDFWSEEDETRAVLSLKRAATEKSAVLGTEDTYYYYDLPISEKCISKVVLGPEFGGDELKAVKKLHGKIDFRELLTEPSRGTGIITNR